MKVLLLIEYEFFFFFSEKGFYSFNIYSLTSVYEEIA